MWLLLSLLLLGFPGVCASQTGLRVMADATLQGVLPEIVGLYRRGGGGPVHVRYAASGRLARQIAAGMTADVLIAADEEHLAWLADQGGVEGTGVVIGSGELVYFVVDGATLRAGDGIEGLGRALDTGRLGRLAIADPDLSPDGRAAREVLLEAGLWARLRPYLVLADDGAQAARFAAGGSARAGLVFAHLTGEAPMDRRGTAVALPEATYGALEYRAVVLPDSADGARDFVDFLQSGEAVERLRGRGLLP